MSTELSEASRESARMAQPDRNTLDSCLQDMRAAPMDSGPVSHLCYRPDFGQRVFRNRLALDTERGVTGDRWFRHAWLRTEDGGPDPRVQVAIIFAGLLRRIWDDADGGAHPGDTIATDMNLSEGALPAGARLKAGTAIIEVSDVFNDGCAKWKVRYGTEAYRWARDPALRTYRPRGIFCRIVQSGVVTADDRLIRIRDTYRSTETTSYQGETR